jgi:hypothetical protein
MENIAKRRKCTPRQFVTPIVDYFFTQPYVDALEEVIVRIPEGDKQKARYELKWLTYVATVKAINTVFWGTEEHKPIVVEFAMCMQDNSWRIFQLTTMKFIGDRTFESYVLKTGNPDPSAGLLGIGQLFASRLGDDRNRELIGIGMSWYDSESHRVGMSVTRANAEQEIDLSNIKAC